MLNGDSTKHAQIQKLSFKSALKLDHWHTLVEMLFKSKHRSKSFLLQRY